MSNDAATKSAKELDKARKESLRKAMGGSKPKQDNELGDENTESKKVEKKLDNDEKNSYINNESSADDSDNSDDGSGDDSEKYKSIFETQFKGDPTKVVKSWSETQSFASQLRQQVKALQQENESMYDVLDKNPELYNLVERAAKGEDIKSFLRSKEPEGKPASSSESKLNTSDTISVTQLTEAGYIKPSDLEYLSETQKAEAVFRAKMQYMQDTLPQTIAKQTATEYRKQIEEQERQRKEQETIRKNQELNSKRWKDGIQHVVETYGLDFTGNDQELLDQVEKYAKVYRDPDNPNVIDEESVLLATERVMRLNGRDLTKRNYEGTKQSAKQNIDEKFGKGFNASSRQDPPKKKPVTIADKLRERRMTEELKRLEKRQAHRRTDK